MGHSGRERVGWFGAQWEERGGVVWGTVGGERVRWF